MTKFEHIKNMDITDLAIYINQLQEQAVANYENGIAPSSIIDNMKMLKETIESNQTNEN